VKLFLGETGFPSVPVAFVNELGATIAIEFDDIGLGWEDSGLVLGQSSGAVNDKSGRYLNRLDLSA